MIEFDPEAYRKMLEYLRREFPLEGCGLLADKQVRPEVVSVELNGRMLERREFDSTSLQSGDQVEVLFFMGGGA